MFYWVHWNYSYSESTIKCDIIYTVAPVHCWWEPVKQWNKFRTWRGKFKIVSLIVKCRATQYTISLFVMSNLKISFPTQN